MKWATRDHIHMDRVATPWLIKRFVDPQAEFVFLPFGREQPIPQDVIPFAIPGAELGPHDAQGSTFRKVMVRYGLDHPALALMRDILESGIHHVFHHREPGYSVGGLPHPEGAGLDVIAHGMMYATASDADNIDKGLIVYEALFQYCRIRLLKAEKPELDKLPPPALWDVVRDELAQRP